MKQKTIICVITLLVIAVGAYQYLEKEEAAQLETINIGLILPLSGKAAGVGQDFLRGTELAQKSAGDSSIRFHVEDTQTDAQKATTALLRLLNTNELKGVVSIQALAVLPLLSLAEEYKLPLLASIATVPQSEYSRKSDWAYLFYPMPDKEIEKISLFLKEKKYQEIAIITVDDAFGQTMAKYMSEKHLGTIVLQESFAISNTDFRLLLTKVKQKTPDAIFFVGYPLHQIDFMKQRQELNLTSIPIISTQHIQSNFVRNEIIGLYGDDYAVVPAALVENNKRLQIFRDTFKITYGIEPDVQATFGYDTFLLLHRAAEIAESQDIEFDAALKQARAQGIYGDIGFNEFKEIEMPLAIVRAETREVVME